VGISGAKDTCPELDMGTEGLVYNGNNFGPSLRRDEIRVEAVKPKELTVRSTY
jgi:hypothetical protein